MIRFGKTTLPRLEFLHQETGKKNFYELLCRDPRCAQGTLCEDIHCAQGSLDPEILIGCIALVALSGILALCRHSWIETCALRAYSDLRSLHGVAGWRSSFFAELIVPREQPLQPRLGSF